MIIARKLAPCVALLLGACASVPEPKTPEDPGKLPDPGADGEYTVEFPEPRQGEDRFIRLTLGRDVYLQCDFAPHFAFNAVKPQPQDEIALRALAECLNRPEVREHDMEIIGRTDSFGSEQYNIALARARARTVKEILTRYGVDTDRMRVNAAGERGAKGYMGDYSHGYDRRVDVILVGQSHAPGRGLARATYGGSGAR